MICLSMSCRKKYLIRAGPIDCTLVGKWSYKTERLIVNPNCFSKNRCGQQFSPSHLSTSTLCSVPARIMTYQCLRSSAISVVIWCLGISSFTRSCHLSFGLPRFRFPSTVICNICPRGIIFSSPLLMSEPSQTLLSKELRHRVHVCLFPDVYISHII